MRKVYLTSLSERGYVEDPKTILAKLFSYYLTTDGQQSYLFKKKLVSLATTYRDHINDPEKMADKMRSELDTYIGTYFQARNIRTEVHMDTESKATILIYGEVWDENNIRVSLGNLVEYDQEGLKRIIDILNYGEGETYIKGLRNGSK